MDGPSNLSLVAEEMVPWEGKLKYIIQASLVAQVVKNNARDPSSIPGLGISPGEGRSYPLQHSWASLVAQTVKNPLQYRRPGFYPWVFCLFNIHHGWSK